LAILNLNQGFCGCNALQNKYNNSCTIDTSNQKGIPPFLFSTIFDNKTPVEKKLQLATECGLPVTTDVKEGINQMCNYSDFVEQQGLKKGREEGHLESLSESVANLVRSGHFSIEAALDILKVSADIRSTVKENAEKALSK
jgi:hypothetical protein